MKHLLIATILVALPCWAAQQSMPGMDMSEHDRPKQIPSQPQQQNAMPGMDMQSPNTTQMPRNMQMPQNMQMPGDMQQPFGQQRGPAASKESESMQNSEAQQKQQEATRPGAQSDAQSFSRDTMDLQEPENLPFHTGEQLAALELLTDIASRPPMSIDDFVSMAERSNPTLAQVRALVSRSQQQGRQAGLLPNPTIAYSGDHIRGGDYGGGEQGAYIQQEFVLGGKLGLRRKVYEQQARSNQIGIDEQTYRVRDTVQQAFYNALTDQALVIVRQRLSKVAMDAVETAHQLANVGQADAPDILQAEVESEQAKIDFVRAQREFLGDFHILAAVAGAQELPVSPLKGELEHPPVIDAEQQVAAVIAGSPTLQRAQQNVAIAEAKLKDAKREPIPNLAVRAGEWYSGETIASSRQAAGPESFVEAGVNLPLWNRNQGNTGAARAELERAQQEVTRTRLDLKQQAEPLAQQYQSARFAAERYRTQLLPRSRRAYELYVMKYQQMAAAYPQVLFSQRTLFQLQVDYLRALQSEWMNALALQNYTLMRGLDQPTGTGTNTTTINLPTGGGDQ